MKKVGKLNETRMVRAEEPKHYPIVSDDLFGGIVKLRENAIKGYKGIKGGTAAAKKEATKRKLKEDDLPMNRRGRITQAGPAPKVDTDTYQTYNSMTDAKDPDWIQGAEADIERRGTKGKCTPITKKGCTGKAKALAKTFKKMAKKNEAKDNDWIQGAEADIKRRGTEGKCTPITKKGCTGKAKALAKTFKKMAKKRDDSIVSKDERKKKVINDDKLGKFNPDVDENPMDVALAKRKQHVQKHGNTPVTAQGNKRVQRQRGEG